MAKRASVRPQLYSDPEWEKVEAARRNIDHDDAAQESVFLQKRFYSLWGHLYSPTPVDLYVVLEALTQKKIPFVLIGAFSFGGWTGRPRATRDVDILARKGRNHSRAVNLLRSLYPQLEIRSSEEGAAFFLPGEKTPVIDVTSPHRADLEETLAHPVWTENKERGLRYRIADLEPALANKCGAMSTPTRDVGRRCLDVVDFAWMVIHSQDEGQRPIDLQRLEALGEKVWPGGGGKEILRLVEQVKAGEPISLQALVKPK